MKTKRKLLSIVSLVTVFLTTEAHAASATHEHGAPRLSDTVKFGMGLGRGFSDGSPMMAAEEGHPAGEYRFLDLFGEYRFSNEYGLQLSVRPTSLHAHEEAVKAGYYTVGLTNRIYVGQEKRLCLFFGLEFSYLGSAKMKIRSVGYGGEAKEVVRDLCKKEDLKKVFGSSCKLEKSQSSLKFGWDYECENGLIIGGIFTSSWATGQEDQRNSEHENMVKILPVNTQQLFYIGYNFAKLIR